MSFYRLRDFLSVSLYRALSGFLFHSTGRHVRIVWPLRIVGGRYLRFADDVSVETGAYIAALPVGETKPSVTFGRGTKIGNHVHIVCIDSIEFGESVLVADRVFIADNQHGYTNPVTAIMDQPLQRFGPVKIGRHSWIGENVCIVGASVGEHCVIGANSVVTRDIPDWCVAAGSPAVPIKRYCPETGGWGRIAADDGPA